MGPHLEYCIQLRGPQLKKKDLLEQVQRRAVEMIPGRSHAGRTFRQFGVVRGDTAHGRVLELDTLRPQTIHIEKACLFPKKGTGLKAVFNPVTGDNRKVNSRLYLIMYSLRMIGDGHSQQQKKSSSHHKSEVLSDLLKILKT